MIYLLFSSHDYFLSVLTTPIFTRFGTGSSLRIPHLLDVLLLLNHVFHTEGVVTPFHPFITGTESEADNFFTVRRPKVFFINCVVTSGFRTNMLGEARYVHVVFPVILKCDQYYIVMGEANTPVYRVLNPKDLFFTPKGKNVLRYLLSRNLEEGKTLDFYERDDGTVDTYCVPNFVDVDLVSDRWDNCADAHIEDLMVFPVVEQPIVPPFCKGSVQIVNLNDKINILDITYPDNNAMKRVDE